MRSILVAAAGLVLALPAAAQTAASTPPPPSSVSPLVTASPTAGDQVAASAAPRQRYVQIIRGEPCPKSPDPNEIIVCGEQEPEDQFRLPPLIREEQSIARRDNVTESRGALVAADSNSGLGGGCSAVGANGDRGCTKGLSVLGAGASVVKAMKGEDTIAEKAPQ